MAKVKLERLAKDYELVLAASKKATGANIHNVNGMIHSYYSTICACNLYVKRGDVEGYRFARKGFDECEGKLRELIR